MKTKIIVAVLITGLVAGAIITVYPMISRQISSATTDEVVSEISHKSADTPTDETDEQFKIARDYNNRLLSAGYIGDYNDILNLGYGEIGILEIEKLNLSLPIYHGTDDETLRKGVGHLSSTPFPIGQEKTNSVLTSHNGLPSAELFTNIYKLDVGDSVKITVLNKTTTYTVSQTYKILPSEVADIPIQSDTCTITLVTCWPYAVNSHRLCISCIKNKE